MNKTFYVYILASDRNGTLYTGMTSEINRRIYEHKKKAKKSFSKKYDVDKLVYFEKHENREQAMQREKQLKKWQRNWKKDLIEQVNPEWNDLYDVL